MSAGAVQSTNDLGHGVEPRLANEQDTDTAGYRQFDEESFSEVLTYYGSGNELEVRLMTISIP